MRITKIEVQKRKPNRRSIYVDDKFVIGIDEEVLLASGWVEGLEIGAKELESIVYAEAKRKAKEKALNLLAYRARSLKELKLRLREKGFDDKCINDILTELSGVGLLDDFEFARAWVRERGNSRGPFKLRSELSAKGVPQEIIEQTLSESKISELTIAKNLTQQWLNSHKHLPQVIQRRRLFGFLARRGISYDTIKSLDAFN